MYTRYGLGILHKDVQRVKTKSQKVWRANLYVCRSYWRKTGLSVQVPNCASALSVQVTNGSSALQVPK